MLNQRVATALLLAPLFVAGVLLLSTPLFATLLALITLAAAWEWQRLAGVNDTGHSVLLLATFAGLLGGSWWGLPQTLILLPAAALCWLWLAWKLYVGRHQGMARWSFAFRLLIGIAALVPAWLALGWLHRLEPQLVLWLFLIIWGADTGAFFCGRRWGRGKLAPAISPNKTVAGLLGGLVAVAILATGIGLAAIAVPLPAWVLLCLLAGLASVVGDLTESQLKRIADVKDSSALLPGHGGILDRIDSVTAAAPVFACGWYVLASASWSPPPLGSLLQ